MVGCKILMLGLALLALKARESQSHPNHILSDSKSDCSCFPADKNGIRISKLADKFGKHDRKVIYLFSHPESGKVTIYLPNEEKQRNFPDLTVSYQEPYGLPKFEHIDQLFKDPKSVVALPGTSRPSGIDLNNLDFTLFNKPKGVVDLSLSPDHITGTKFDKKPVIFEIKPESPNQFGIQLGQKDVSTGNKVKSYGKPSAGDKKIVLDLNNAAPQSLDLVAKPVTQVLDGIHLFPGHEKDVFINKPLKQVKNKPNLYDLNNSNKFLNNGIHGMDINLRPHNIVLDLSGKKINPLNKPVGKLNLILGHDHKIPFNQNAKHLDQDREEIPGQVPESKPIIDTSSGIEIFPASILTKPTDEVYQIDDKAKLSHGLGPNLVNTIPALLVGNNNNAMPSPLNTKPASSPALDNWLLEEINNIENSEVDTSSPQTNDLQKIKNNLLNVLKQNQLHVSDNGDLVDVSGHIMKMSHLKLRKVMISDPTIYKKLLSSGKCVINHEIPYLEALFVNLVYPPKILGLIPLRMTTLPRCSESRCADKTCGESRDAKPSTSNTRITAKLNLALPKYTDLSPTKVTKKTNKEQEEPIKVDSGVKNQDLAQKPTVALPAGGDEIDDDDDDGLGIRIIGGNAATSSGTPVSSRGRSGLKSSSLFSV